MIQLFGSQPDQVELLMVWMKTHPRKRPEEMPEELFKLFQRLHLAHTWLTKHGSQKAVWPMLLAHYKALDIPYSESTARRDVKDAMLLFGGVDRQTIVWLTAWQVDNLIERQDSCKRAGKDKEFALLSAQLDKWMLRYERIVLGDEQAIHTPVPILAIHAPLEAGLPENPNIAADIQAYLKKRAEKLRKGPDSAIDAEFTEVP